MSNDFFKLNASEKIVAFENGEISATQIAEKALSAIEATEPQLDAYMTIMANELRAQAKDIDERKAKGEKLGELAGTTIAIKDNMCIDGVLTTCSSKMLENWVAPYDATVITKLKEADCLIVGKTNMDEFAMGSSTENSAFKTTKNPHDLSRVPGGSSGGSAATVASGAVDFSLGSDTGGSIRQPASFCGIVGVKPTYGRVSRYGVVAFGSSLDQIGPFARNVSDAALLTDVLSGHDKMDSTSIDQEYASLVKSISANKGIEGLRVGIISELAGPDGFQKEVMDAFNITVSLLEKNGAKVDTVSIPSAALGISAYYIIAPAEASSNLARFDGMRYGLRVEESTSAKTNASTRASGFGEEVKRRIMLGTYALSAGFYDAFYAQAQKVRTVMMEQFAQAYENFDVLITPTAPTTSFVAGTNEDDPLQMYLNDLCTIPVNLVGACAMSVPVGVDDNNMPIGVQVCAPPLGEEVMFEVAKAIETLSDYSIKPGVWAG
jgi:aspartyl-tRNA(Asn)/glutamyl-tRNA(Gln) amidotransferase subunit A